MDLSGVILFGLLTAQTKGNSPDERELWEPQQRAPINKPAIPGTSVRACRTKYGANWFRFEINPACTVKNSQRRYCIWLDDINNYAIERS